MITHQNLKVNEIDSPLIALEGIRRIKKASSEAFLLAKGVDFYAAACYNLKITQRRQDMNDVDQIEADTDWLEPNYYPDDYLDDNYSYDNEDPPF